MGEQMIRSRCGRVRSVRALAMVGAAALLALGACATNDGADPLPFTRLPGQGVFLIVSDLHFDPFADPAIVKELVAADVQAWPAIFESSKLPGFAQYGNDSNYPLMASALEAARRILPRPDFVLYPGDYLAHEFERSPGDDRRRSARVGSFRQSCACRRFVDQCGPGAIAHAEGSPDAT
jgi:hypothetical protein